MNGTKTLFDSNAIIYASQGIIDANRLLSETGTYYASIITFIEVYSYNFTVPTEKEIIDEILLGLEIVDLSREIAEQAIIFRKNSSKKIKLPDAVILATAKLIGADLATNNVRDFAGIDPSIDFVDLDDFKS